MAWYCGTYSCGHNGRVDVVGPYKDREWKIDRHFEGICPECYEKKRKEDRKRENREAAEKSSEMGLPELLGSEKQVAWANTIRIKFAVKFERSINRFKKIPDGSEIMVMYRNSILHSNKNEILNAIDFCLKSKKQSRFWIEKREEDIQEILAEIIKEMRKNDIPEEVREELEEGRVKLTVVPEKENLKSGVVEIEYKENILSAKYIKDQDFMEIVKSLNYKWNGAAWYKKITEYTGTADNRAAELGNKLLSFGFTVKFPNKESKEKAISSDFEIENDRWIKYNSELKKLSIMWNGRNNTLYESAKKLPGAKWGNGCMRVKIEFYKEVEDFADTMGFSISSKARVKIEEYKQKESGFETAEVSIKIKEALSDEERIEKSLKSNGTIIEDLIDD